MRKQLTHKIIITVLAVLVLCAFGRFLFTTAFIYEPRLVIIMQLMSEYIEANNNHFPETSEDFKEYIEHKGYSFEDLKIRDFAIKYGFSANSHEKIEGEVFLITGPRDYGWPIGSLRRRYRIMSVHWVGLMTSDEGETQ